MVFSFLISQHIIDGDEDEHRPSRSRYASVHRAHRYPRGRATVPAWCVLVPVIVSLVIIVVASQRSDGRLHMWVLNVGEGDAILLRTPLGHTVLVDGGPGITPLAEGIGEHLPFWRRNLDIAVLTAPRQENMMGLVDLLGRYKIGQVVQTDFTATTSLQQTWLNTLGGKSTPVYHVKRGDVIGFEDEPDVIMRVLNPGEDDILKGDATTMRSNTSIVLRVEYGDIRMLLAGDIEAGAEANILRLAGDVKSQVLKVASHGSDSASSPRFIAAVMPQVSVISVATDNKLGYPSPNVLNMLHDRGARIYRTDQDGTVEVIAEKSRFWVRSQR
jgi:competence protein ComEC